jgi:predicted RNA-binding Zn ribbon-like protein
MGALADLRVLNTAMRAAPSYHELAARPASGVVSQLRRDGPLRARLAAVLAEAAVELLTDPAVTTVRACEAPCCTLLFLPAHPRRRWCAANRCGNRSRVARYYQRRRAT